MKVETLLQLATTAFQQKFREICPEAHLPDLSSDSFERLVAAFKEAFSHCGTTALKTYLESCDVKDPVLNTPSGKVRFKMESPKEFLTPFGWVPVTRRLYRTDSLRGKPCSLG